MGQVYSSKRSQGMLHTLGRQVLVVLVEVLHAEDDGSEQGAKWGAHKVDPDGREAKAGGEGRADSGEQGERWVEAAARDTADGLADGGDGHGDCDPKVGVTLHRLDGADVEEDVEEDKGASHLGKERGDLPEARRVWWHGEAERAHDVRVHEGATDAGGGEGAEELREDVVEELVDGKDVARRRAARKSARKSARESSGG